MSWELVYILSGVAVLPVFIVSVIISLTVETRIARYRQVPARSGLTARQLVAQIATRERLNIRVELASRGAGDHYDPRTKCVRLSEKIIDSTSVSALAIAAHECGHAIQDAEGYLPLKTRQVVIRVSNFGSRLLTPLIILSAVASIFVYTAAGYDFLRYLLLGFCIVYGLAATAGLVTLPVEFNASRRGEKLLAEMNVLDATEQRAARKVLSAAAQTYVVSFALSILYFLRYLSYFMLLFGERDR